MFSMRPNHSEFFEQATCQLLQTLDLQEGLERLQAYISSVLPCGEIRLSCFPSYVAEAAKNLHIRATAKETSTYYGAPLTAELMQVLLSLAPSRGEIISDPDHPLVKFCQSLNASGHGLMPLPWYDLVLWDDERLLGECRFSGLAGQDFTQHHCTLLNSLRPVLCIALSNYQKCLEMQAAHDSVKRENTTLKRALTGDMGDVTIVGAQGGLRPVLERVRLVAKHNLPVLITGETGTGKELIARMVHGLSPRRDQAFIALNCGAIPSSLIDSELFGYAKGAFTGATQNSKGYFERADKGTIFLDEIGELPQDAQVRLLRVLQEHEIQPVGNRRPIAINTRIIAATNRDIHDMMTDNIFRKDLYYRLRVVHILLPALRERPEDIPALTHHILLKTSESMGIPLPALKRTDLDRLMQYPWPGNVRELQNVLTEALVCTAPGSPLEIHLDPRQYPGGSPFKNTQPVRVEAGLPELTSDAVLARHYQDVLRACNGQIKGSAGAAAVLGVNPSTLRFRLKKFGILDATTAGCG